jgi:hypothetical protein
MPDLYVIASIPGSGTFTGSPVVTFLIDENGNVTLG